MHRWNAGRRLPRVPAPRRPLRRRRTQHGRGGVDAGAGAGRGAAAGRPGGARLAFRDGGTLPRHRQPGTAGCPRQERWNFRLISVRVRAAVPMSVYCCSGQAVGRPGTRTCLPSAISPRTFVAPRLTGTPQFLRYVAPLGSLTVAFLPSGTALAHEPKASAEFLFLWAYVLVAGWFDCSGAGAGQWCYGAGQAVT